MVTASKVWKEVASEPKLTAQPCPMQAIITAWTGVKPSPTSSGAATATGTPKPPMPCKKEANSQPSSRPCIVRSAVSAGSTRPTRVDRAGLVRDVEEQQRRPDDVEHVQGEQDGLDLGISQQFRPGAEEERRHHQRRQPAQRSGAAAAPAQAEHEHQHDDHGQESEQPGEEIEGHGAIIPRAG